MNPMRKYEGLFIFPPEESPEVWKEEEKRIEETLRRFGGRTLERRDWGRRPLGYPLRKNREGRVLFWNFEMETGQVKEFRKALELDEKILKSAIMKAPIIKAVKESSKDKKADRPNEAVQEKREGPRARYA